jgi:enediyne core biosynthesis thioesterase
VRPPPAYEIRHRVGLEETNLVGNVYFVNHLRWQGRCREMFLAEHAPEVLEELKKDLALATVRCSCEYLAELDAFDEIAVRMRLAERAQNRLTLRFEYVRLSPAGEELVARGEQQVACLRREGGRAVPAPIPEALALALVPFSE